MKLPKLKDLPAFWYHQRIVGFATPTEPRMDLETIDFLTEQLRSARLYVEFGSGGSTIIADRLGVRTISVESDRFYAAAVRKGLERGTVTVLTPRIGVVGPWGYPMFRKKTPSRLKRWRRYLDAPFAGGELPDLILVDGRFRVACALGAARRVVDGGGQATLIIDDYLRRTRYHVVETYLGPARMVGRAGVFRIADQQVPRLEITDVR